MDHHDALGIYLLSIFVSALLFLLAGVLDDIFSHRRWAIAFAVLAALFAAPVLLRLLALAWTI